MLTKKSCWVPVAFGVALILIGLLFPTPGMALTTYSYMDGKSTESYSMGGTYTAIDEYVGGDAYNFIIGAALVAGKLSGAMTVKGIFVAGGLLCLCAGVTMLVMQYEREAEQKKEPEAPAEEDQAALPETDPAEEAAGETAEEAAENP